MKPHTVLLGCADAQRLAHWQAAVRRTDCLPLEATTVREALEWARAICPDLVLSDAALPEGGAVSLLRALRDLPPLGAVPVVVRGELSPLGAVPVVVRGELSPRDTRAVARDEHARVQQIDDADSLIGVLDELVQPA